ncbi:hypothetical protein JJB09_04405 [Rhizobium sp. KVB221]|uniref:Uncharacterized protein n=1 Tax=Rhizobium setariae TaxID=2801340 RepID=A0A936YJE1_9HYPH|nr:hypothetical protein [Rhizobium setariae]MBL0371263.1 hypothetical protein [Rhizobium setariae]
MAAPGGFNMGDSLPSSQWRDKAKSASRNQYFFNLVSVDIVDTRTIIEHKKNIREQEAQMTDFLRDMAAFTSVVMFVASFAVLMVSL